MPAIRRLAELVAVGVWLTCGVASADPQISVGLLGAGGASELRTRGPIGVFAMGLRGDALFFRRGDRDFAFGPYAEVMTVAFETFEAGGGASLLIPITDQVPLVVSFGVHARGYDGGWEPGLETMLWMGSRSYNFHSLYGLAVGGFIEGRYGLGDGKQADILGGVQVDLEVFALPFILLYNAFR